MIKNIVISKHKLHFKKPFKIAYEEVDKTEVVIIKLIDIHGCVGLGSAAPDTEVTDERISDVYKILRKKLTPSFFCRSLDEKYFYHEKFADAFAHFPSAQAAAEEALFSLFSKHHKVKPESMLGDYRKTCPIMFTLGIKNPQETLQEARKQIKKGFLIFKIKVGLDVKEDILTIKTLKRGLPKHVQLVADANQGYSLKEALFFLKNIRKKDIVFLEQPVKATNWQGLKKLKNFSTIPIIADESCVSVADAVKLMTEEYVDGITIKLMKCGGIINFLKIYYTARALKKMVGIGCMYESNISITTGARLALSLPMDFVDLDSGRFDFDDDPSLGGAVVKDGAISIPNNLSMKTDEV